MAAGELHPDWTVMAIWPSPMIYAGPTEVRLHASYPYPYPYPYPSP